MKPRFMPKQIKNSAISVFYQYVLALIIIGLTTLFCTPLSTPQGYHIVSFILLFVVALMAVFMGIGPILLASTMSAVVWNFFFIPPYHTFHIAKTEDKLMFGSFFIIALLNGVLTNRIRRNERMVAERELQTSALFQLTGELSKARGTEQVLKVVKNDFKKHFNGDSIIILQDGKNRLELSENAKDFEYLPGFDIKIAGWVFENNKKAGKFTKHHSDNPLTYHPLTGTRLNPGVIAFNLEQSEYMQKDAFWDTYFTQISNALEREFLGEVALKARVLEESGKLYKTLFNLISHEFRIPIATIMGASDTLLANETSEKNREELLNEIFKASGRLNHLIENLLNMSRLESGKLSVRPNWCDINDLINKVIQNLQQELDQFNFKVYVADDFPLVKLDFGLMEQVLNNLLVNSCRHSPPLSEISLKMTYEGGNVIMTVTDHGEGFPVEALPKVFNKFFRVDGTKTGGLGLGLSIVKGLVEAHKGTVKVENVTGGGAKFTIIIPSEIPDMNEISFEK